MKGLAAHSVMPGGLGQDVDMPDGSLVWGPMFVTMKYVYIVVIHFSFVHNLEYNLFAIQGGIIGIQI